VLIASAYLLGVGLVYGLGMILLMITVIGLIAVPFAAFAVGVTASHLYAQAFEDD
jgi:Na+/H+ antiporter NhaB